MNFRSYKDFGKPLLLLAGAMVLLLMGYTGVKESLRHPADNKNFRTQLKKMSRTVLRCSPDWSAGLLQEEGVPDIMLLPGTGSHVWKIGTGSDSAQLYFNQGINLYYGFHIIEAIPSFKKALHFDSTAAILYWALALAYGPNINDMGYVASPEALLAVSKARFYMNNASAKEKGLINAMAAHYSADSTADRTLLNQAYAARMKALYIKYPNDAEIGSLYADALMNLHPWDFWKHNGHPQPWTPELINVLENTIKNKPDHPGANHYFIHTMEASPYARRAGASADKLGSLAPGLAHMVHMPSHIYIRTGKYEKGRAVNEAAVKNYYAYRTLFPDVANSAFLYEYHNLHMQAASSMNMADYSIAIRDARECRKSIDTSYLSADAPLGGALQYMYMTPLFTMIGFEKWPDILSEPLIPYQQHYGKLIQEFARGMAFAYTGDPDKAKLCLVTMDSLLKEKDMSVILQPFNAPVSGGTVAKYILMGTIAEKENNMQAAIQYFEKGVATEDSMVYQEPRDWLVPARHYLANTLLKQGKYKAAEKVFLQDMQYQPNNYISTSGLRKARHPVD